MKGFNTFILFLLIVTACKDEDTPLNPLNLTTFFGENGETYHTGSGGQAGDDYYYKRNAEGKILWSFKVDKSVSTYNQVIILPDGSSIVYALGDNQVYKFSPLGQLDWLTTSENFNGYVAVHEDQLWLPGTENNSLGMKILDLETGNQLAKVLLPDLEANQLSRKFFSYDDGAMFLIAHFGYDHIELIKFDETGQLWRQANDNAIFEYRSIYAIHLNDGLSVVFDENNMVYKFDSNGIFVKKYALETAGNTINELGTVIPNNDGTFEIVNYLPAEGKLLWTSINSEGVAFRSSTISVPHPDGRPVDYKITPDGILLSVSAVYEYGENRYLLKSDGTYLVIL